MDPFDVDKGVQRRNPLHSSNATRAEAVVDEARADSCRTIEQVVRKAEGIGSAPRDVDKFSVLVGPKVFGPSWLGRQIDAQEQRGT